MDQNELNKREVAIAKMMGYDLQDDLVYVHPYLPNKTKSELKYSESMRDLYPVCQKIIGAISSGEIKGSLFKQAAIVSLELLKGKPVSEIFIHASDFAIEYLKTTNKER